MNRQLRFPSLVMIGLGATVGAGAFVVTGTVAAHYAGPAVTLSFVVAGLVCLIPAACYAEFARSSPDAAGAYSFTTLSMGRFAGWMTGWCVLLEYLMAAATLAVGWSAYTCRFLAGLGLAPSTMWTRSVVEWRAGAGLHVTGALLNVPAVAVVLLLCAALCAGTRQSARLAVTVALTKMLTIAVILAFAALHLTRSNWHPFIPANTGHWGEFGTSGVIRGASAVFFAFLGFDVVAAVAREVQDPQHVVPRAILTVILICVAVYVLMALAVTGLIPYADLDVPNPITFALAQLTSGLLGASVGLGTIVGLTSGIFSILFAQARVFLVMSQDRLLPATLSTLSKRSGAPKVATGTAGVIAAILAGVFPINVLSELISIGTLAIFVMVCVGIFVLRMNALTVVRTIRAYRILLVPVAGILGCLFMMVSLPRETWQRFAVWLAIGILIFSASRLVQRQRRRLAASRADLSLRCE